MRPGRRAGVDDVDRHGSGRRPRPGRSAVLVLCTGNAARSVMAGYMLEYLAEAGRARAAA